MKIPWRNRRFLLAVAASAVLLVAIAIAAVLLTRTNPEGKSTPLSNFLPSGDSREQSLATPTAVNSPKTTSQPTPKSTEIPQNIAVSIKYSRDPSFNLEIEKVELTPSRTTTEFYQPSEGAPFSYVRLLDSEGRVVREERVYVQTKAIFDGATPGGVHGLTESTAYIVMAIPPNASIAAVELVTQDGKSWDLEQLKTPLAGIQQNIISSVFQWLTSKVQAQTQGTFNLVVINEQGAADLLAQASIAVSAITTSTEPWITFANNVKVTTIPNGESLGCKTVILDSGIEYPQCPNADRVISRVAQEVPGWDAIVVVHPHPCNCGSVATGLPPIVALGSQLTTRLVVHELGHTIGKMLDEYFYQFGSTDSDEGPNCFPTADACQEALKPYADDPYGECSLGCDTTTTYRPASRIMHNTFSPLEFGPIERCVMGKAIAKVVNLTYTCGSTQTPTPSPTGTPGTYWGWYR